MRLHFICSRLPRAVRDSGAAAGPDTNPGIERLARVRLVLGDQLVVFAHLRVELA